MSTAVTHIIKGRPIANLSSVVTGVNPIIGAPMTTAIAVAPNINRIV